MMFRRKRQTKRDLALLTTSLSVESLEDRCMLSGMVGIDFTAAPLLKLVATDGLANDVVVRQAEPFGADAFIVTGVNGTHLDTDNDGTADLAPDTPFLVAGVTNIRVDLGSGDDTFSFLSRADGTGVNSEIDGYVAVICSLGTNTVNIGDATGPGGVKIGGDLCIRRPNAVNIFSTTITNIYNSEVVGDTLIEPGRIGPANNGGDSTTTIENTDLRGKLTFQARVGDDVFNLQDSNVGGDVVINTVDPANRAELGESAITFTGTTGNVNKVEGSITVVTSSPAANFIDEDLVTFNQTETEELVNIDVGNGPASVSVAQGSLLGTDQYHGPQNLTISYGAADPVDQSLLEVKDSTVTWAATATVTGSARLQATVEGSDIGWTTARDLTVNGDAGVGRNTDVSLKQSAMPGNKATRVGRDVVVTGTPQDDSLDIRDGTLIGRDVVFTSLAGNDVLDLYLALNGKVGSVRDVTHISTDGDDQLNIINDENQSIRNLTAKLGAKQDKVDLKDVTVTAATEIRLDGDAKDELKLEDVLFSGPLILHGGGGAHDLFIGDAASRLAYEGLSSGFEDFETLP